MQVILRLILIKNLLYINITIHSEKFHFYQQLQSLLYINITIHSRKFHFIILIKVIINHEIYPNDT